MDEAHSIPRTFGISLLVTMSTIASRMDRAYADGDTRVKHARSVSACWTNGFTAGVFDTFPAECLPTETRKFTTPVGDLLNCNCVTGYSGMFCDQSK